VRGASNIQSESEDFEDKDSNQFNLSDEEEEKNVPSPALSKKSSSRMQKDFDKSLNRAQTQGSVVLEQFDFTDMKRVLRERLVNYKQAIDYCIQIGQEKDVVKDLITKVSL
jgi:predicted transcriptional regulator